MRSHRMGGAALLLGLSVAVFGCSRDAPPSGAEPEQRTEGAEAAAEPTTDVTEDEIREFSRVQVQLIGLQESYQQRAQAGEDPEQLQTELQEKARDVVEESELSMERFEEIATTARDEPALRQRVEQEMIRQLRN